MSKKRQRADEQQIRQQLAIVDADELEDFSLIDRADQQRIVENYRSLAADKSVPMPERKIAKARAEQFRKKMESEKDGLKKVNKRYWMLWKNTQNKN